MTYDIVSGKYADYGPIFLDNGQRARSVNSIAVGKDSSVYAISQVTEDGHTRSDLIRIRYQ